MSIETEDEREWLRQERALELERLGAAPDADPELARQRRLARLIAARVEEPVPSDLAARVVAATARERALTARLERNLLFAMLAVFALAAAGALFVYGGEWLAAFGPRFGLARSPWLLALLGAMALSHAFGALLAPRRLRPLAFALPAA